MSTLTWFRRFHTREFPGSRVSINTESILNSAMNTIRLDKIFNTSVNLCRQFHVTPLYSQVKSNNMVPYLRNHYLYMTPEHMSEDFRSKMKYLTSKTNQMPLNQKNVLLQSKNKQPKEGDEVSRSMASSEGSAKTGPSVNDTISVTATRNETAREFIRPPDYQITEMRPNNKNRVACPKPSALSPYARHTDDMEAPTLKNHYMKVLCQPLRSFGVTFPPPPPKINTHPNNKTRRLDQYLSNTNSSPVMPTNVNSKVLSNSPQNRSFQSSAGPDVSDANTLAPSESSYDYVKKANDNRYLEMCNASDDMMFNKGPKTLKRKHVEMVKMEVIKLDKKLKRSKRHTDINRELEHVLQEALAQTKVYEQNVLHAQEYEYDEVEDFEDYQPQRKSFMSVKTNSGRFGTPRSSHTAVVLDQEGKGPQPRVSFDSQTRNRQRSRSEDGKHCYNVLKTAPTEAPASRESLKEKKEVKADTQDDVSMALTDLNGYDDGTDSTSNKVVSQMVSSGYRSAADMKAKPESPRLQKLEKEIRIAQRQHNQRVLDVFDIMKGLRVK